MSGKKHFISLKTKIMISTLVPVIVSFILICSVIFSLLLGSLRETAESKFLQVSQKYARSFDNKINSAMNYLSILSSELEVQIAAGSADREMLQKTVMKIFEDYNLIDGSSVYFEPDMYDGRDTDYAGSEYGTAKSGRMCWYFYIDDGKTAYLPEAMENDVEFELPHYTEAKEANKPIYTDPVVYEIDGRHIPMFTLTYPIHDTGGRFIGAVTVDLFLEDIYAQLQNEKIYETGYIIIANDNNKIIYCPKYEDIGKSREEAGLAYPLPSEDEAAVFFNAKSVINGKDALVTIESVYIPRLDSIFYISVSAPMDEINAEGNRLTLFLYSFSLLIIIAIAVLLYYLIGKISAPLNEITESVNRIADGDYNARIKGAYKGEFAVVKDSVNMMANSIESYIEESKSSLDILKSILNGLEAVIYVSDPDTDEILFINDSMKELFNFEDDGVGKICWKVFQKDFEARCEFCPCHQLDKEPGKVVVWEEHNTVTKRYYRNTDRYISWVGGRKAHLQHSIDITDIKMAQFTLDKRLEQQALMISLSQSFLSYTDIASVIKDALRMIGEFMGVAQILFYELGSDGITLICRNEWMDPQLGLQTRIGSKLELKGSMLAYMSKLSNNREFCLTSDNRQVKDEMATYRMNFQSYITTPVYIKENICAVLDFSREYDCGEWTESDINLATLVSSLLSGVFDRHSMEDQLRRLSSIVESSPQFISYITPDGEVNYVNPAAMTITGYTEEELIKGGLDMIFDMQAVREIKEIYIPKTLNDGTDNFELNLFCKGGLKRIMAFSSFITGMGSANVGCIASDVTEIRKLESELIVAKELAEQGSRSKSEFLSRMSHEMRTPMNAIIGMTNIAKNSADPAKKEYCLEKIENASSHLLGVINDILDMSKIEANKFELALSEFSFESMVLRVLNVINFRADEKHQELSFHIDPSIPAVLINDEQRLAQVITNLLTNAVKFTPDGGLIQFRAFVLAEDAETVTLQIEVIDSGIGISKEQQLKLFRSFEQADGSIARRFGGTGLGLAISKRIVEMMGGEIWVESDLDKGSKFIFTMQAKKGQHIAMDSLKTRIGVSELNIIVVDDSPEVLDYFKYVMDDIGIPCVAASDGAQALELFENSPKPFDIAFIDWKMPEMNGIELTIELRKLYKSHSPIIIMISASEWSDIENEATEAGVNGFVPKPLFPSLLIDCINKQIAGITNEESANVTTGASLRSYEGKTALLAEDVEINREIVLTILEDTKLKIECAENGRQAVDMFAAAPEKYNIIFMDIHMPEVDGLEATRMIRALDAPESAVIPIIAMTANVFNEDIKKCLAAGMNDHIGKPIDFNELFGKLEKYLNNFY